MTDPVKFHHLTETDPVAFERKRRVNEIALEIIALDLDLIERVRAGEAAYVYVFDEEHEEHHASAVAGLLDKCRPDITDATVLTGAHREIGLLSVIVVTPRDGLSVADLFNRHAVKPAAIH